MFELKKKIVDNLISSTYIKANLEILDYKVLIRKIKCKESSEQSAQILLEILT